ncbi:proton-coupled folate transporter-like [Stegodyphus dumicola]|uniref:proton-coupled folate transporter-like n=1 Tax=Stegodyphus dumicola TaxID=202533 RepID=UPI0015AF2BC5|nr:proton-coupled folate transporter-like [Stegodyphus dumicola]
MDTSLCDFIKSKIKLITVEPVLFLYMMIIFLETNALQELIYVKLCLHHYPVNETLCSHVLKDSQKELLNETTKWVKYYGCFLFLSTFLISFYVASWSDRYGRKITMLIPPIGTIIASCINFVLSVYINTHVAYFFISAVVSGLSFGSVGVIAATFGFISDITREESRTKRIVVLEAMIFIGGTCGIHIAGALLSNEKLHFILNSFAQLFFLELIIAAIIVIYVVLRIPRWTLQDQSLNTSASFKEVFNLKYAKDSFKVVFRRRDSDKRKCILLIFLALFFIYFGSVVQTILGYLYVKNLEWEFSKYSHYYSVQFIVEGVALLFGLPLIIHFLHVSDHFVAILGLFSRMAGYMVYGLSTNDAMVYSCAALYMFSEFPIPALRSILSKTVDAGERGSIFAFMTILQNLCYLLGSLILGTIFNASSFRGLSFEVVAAMQALALIIILYLYFTRKKIITIYKSMENEDGGTEESCDVICTTGSIN